jgi:hypothetical protein
LSQKNKTFFRFSEDILRDPIEVTRSSTVHYFCHNDNMTTQIHFMNYWLEKRDVVDIKMVLTLRTMEGKTVFQEQTLIKSKGAHIIEISELLKKIFHDKKISEGSIEVEFFSKTNLVISYPASVVRYVGNTWHTLAHSSQRYFSKDSGDNSTRLSEIEEAEEGNITIHNDDNLEPFFIIHNGPKHISQTNIQVKVTSQNGAELLGTIKNIEWLPYQTRLFHLKDILDYRKFLKQNHGMLTVKFDVFGVFPRIIAGHKSKITGSWSIDHTNFAASDGPVLDDRFDVSQNKDFKNLVFCMPNNFKDKWECFADIYPTYPDDDYEVTVNKIKLNGDKNIEHFKLKKSTTSGFPRIRAHEDANYEIIFNHNSKLPRRFHMGIHYKIGSGNYGFLTDGPFPFAHPANRTRWFPVFDSSNCDNFVMLANRVLGSEKSRDLELQFKLFNSFNEEPLIGKYTLLANQAICLNIRELFSELTDFLRGKFGWIYMTGTNPHRCVVHYASVKNQNSLALCHAF